MVYTIKVKKKREDEESGYRDLERFHGECFGGKLKWHRGLQHICQRCIPESSTIREEDT